MTTIEEEQLKVEIAHIFDSGANEIRVFEMAKSFINSRQPVNKNECISSVSDCTYPTEYVILAKPNFLHKSGEIVEADIAEINGIVYYVADKSELYSC